jgi:FkbM family methyltransferase
MEVLDFDSCVSRAIKTYGEWAQDEIDLIGGFLRPGSCVFDIGAFIGTHTLAFSRLVGEQGKVYSFEPRREIFDILTKNIELNNLGNVTAFNAAVSDELSNVGLSSLSHSDDANLGGLALYDSPFVSGNGDYSVKVVSIDSLDIDQVDLIKIDVEGMEDSVLNGAVETIKKHRPIIFAECNSLSSGVKLLSLSERHGYTVLGALTNAFSPNNFNGVEENYFSDAKELGLLLIPRERLVEFEGVIARLLLPYIDDTDALAMILLHKPQYYVEVLKGTSPGKSLGLTLPLPFEFAKSGNSTNEIEELREILKKTTDLKTYAETIAQEHFSNLKRLENELTELTAARALAESAVQDLQAKLKYLRKSLWNRIFYR